MRIFHTSPTPLCVEILVAREIAAHMLSTRRRRRRGHRLGERGRAYTSATDFEWTGFHLNGNAVDDSRARSTRDDFSDRLASRVAARQIPPHEYMIR